MGTRNQSHPPSCVQVTSELGCHFTLAINSVGVQPQLIYSGFPIHVKLEVIGSLGPTRRRQSPYPYHTNNNDHKEIRFNACRFSHLSTTKRRVVGIQIQQESLQVFVLVLFGIFKLLFSPWREWDVFTNFEKKSAS
jgi:hypothetical protein